MKNLFAGFGEFVSSHASLSKKTFGLVGLLVLIAAVPLTVFISQQKTETQQHASGPVGSSLNGFLWRSLMMADGHSGYYQKCTVANGITDWNTCPGFTFIEDANLRGLGNERYKSLDAYVLGTNLWQSVISQDGRTSYYHVCPITQTGDIQWQQCGGWNQVDIFNLRGTGNESYIGLDQVVIGNNLYQSFLESNGVDSWGQTCPIQNGSVDFHQCSGLHRFHVPDIGVGSGSFVSFNVAVIGTQLIQTFIDSNSVTWSHQCNIVNGAPDWSSCNNYARYGPEAWKGNAADRFTAFDAFFIPVPLVDATPATWTVTTHVVCSNGATPVGTNNAGWYTIGSSENTSRADTGDHVVTISGTTTGYLYVRGSSNENLPPTGSAPAAGIEFLHNPGGANGISDFVRFTYGTAPSGSYTINFQGSAAMCPAPTATTAPTATATPTSSAPTATPTTAAPTATTAPTNTLAPTATPVPNSTTFDFTFTLPGITAGKTLVKPQRNVEITLLNQSGTPVGVPIAITNGVTYDTVSGRFSGKPSAGLVPAGTYQLKVKVDGYLYKKLPGIFTIQSGSQTLPNVVVPQLVAGDFNNDNMLDISDYNIFLNYFQTQQPSLGLGACSSSDLNGDNAIDEFDYNIFLRSFTFVQGD